VFRVPAPGRIHVSPSPRSPAAQRRSCTCPARESYVNPAYAGASYINAIKAYVSLLNANGIVAILDLHWTDGAYTGPSSGCSSAQAICQKPMPDAAQAIPFWTSVANTFKGNNAVILDLFKRAGRPRPQPGRVLALLQLQHLQHPVLEAPKDVRLSLP
jgi:hypothetical protein